MANFIIGALVQIYLGANMDPAANRAMPQRWCRGSLSSTRSNPSYSWPQSKDATTRRARLARTPLSGIFRSVDELKAPNLGCFQPFHGSKADDTSRCIIFALGNQQRRLRIKGSAMWAEEGATF